MLKPHSSRRSTACQIRFLPNTVRALNCGLVGNEVKLHLGNRLACLIGDFAAEQLPLLQVQSHSVRFLFHDLVAGMLGRTALGLRHQVPLPGTQLSKPDLAILIRFHVPRDQIALVMRGHSEFLDTPRRASDSISRPVFMCGCGQSPQIQSTKSSATTLAQGSVSQFRAPPDASGCLITKVTFFLSFFIPNR